MITKTANEVAAQVVKSANPWTISEILKDLRSGMLTKTPAVTFGLAALGIYGIKKTIEKIQNSTKHKILLEDLMKHDPIISKADRDQVLEYYATIYNIAPTIAGDKNAVRELLESFIKFGRVDMATLKTLSEIEKNLNSNNFNLKQFI